MRDAAVALPRWGRFALAATVLLLGWCAVRNAADQLWSIDRPDRAALFRPASGDALASIAQARIVLAGGHVDARARLLTAESLRRAPDSADPLILAGLAASDDGDLDRAARLMAAARARDPRATIARSWLLDHFMRSGDYAAGLGEVGAVLRLRPGSQGPVLAILSALMAMPRGATSLRVALVGEPTWRTTFFTTATQYGADPAALADLLALIPAAPDPSAARTEQSAVLRALVDRGGYAQAYRTWREFLPPAYRDVPAGIYDPSFAGWPGAAPFNWTLQPDDGSVARIAPKEGEAGRHVLSLVAGGDAPAVLAEEYAIVEPGAQDFRVVARQLGSGPTGLVARLVCASDASVLATIPLDTLAPRFASYRTAATIPARCGAVRVQFASVPGDGAPPATVEVAAVRLSRPGG